MSRRHATKALLATAAVSAVTLGGFGVLTQSASGASAQPSCSILDLGCVLGGGGSSSAAPTKTTTATATATSTVTATATTTITVTPTATSSASSQTKPKSDTNVTLSKLRIVQHGKKFTVSFTVTNTGTLSIGAYLIVAHIPGYQTHAWLANLPVDQPVRVTNTWRIRAGHKALDVAVKGDPKHQVKESDLTDNVLSGSKRLR